MANDSVASNTGNVQDWTPATCLKRTIFRVMYFVLAILAFAGLIRYWEEITSTIHNIFTLNQYSLWLTYSVFGLLCVASLTLGCCYINDFNRTKLWKKIGGYLHPVLPILLISTIKQFHDIEITSIYEDFLCFGCVIGFMVATGFGFESGTILPLKYDNDWHQVDLKPKKKELVMVVLHGASKAVEGIFTKSENFIVFCDGKKKKTDSNLIKIWRYKY